MDIEGGEFEIIRFYLDNWNKFNFKKGVIEFHFSTDLKKRLNCFNLFLEKIKKENFLIFIFDNRKKYLSLTRLEERIKSKELICFNLEFFKTIL